MQNEPPGFAHVGELLIGAVLSVIAWLINTFTRAHLDSMDKLSGKMESLSGDVREMKTDIRTLREHADKTDERIERLEQKD